MKDFVIPSKAWQGFKGYMADEKLCPVDYLAPPSINVLVDENGEIKTRMGHEDTSWNLGEANKAPRTFYFPRFDITFFALGTKVKYIDHNRSNAVVTVTGITLTDGTVTRFWEYAGDVYLMNTADGVYRIVVSKIATSNIAGGDLNVESDIGPRLSSFGLGTGDVLVNGTTETYASVSLGATTTLDTTATQGYSAGDIVLRVDQRSSLPKGSIGITWKERMVIGGVSTATASVDQPNASLHFSKFALAGTLENIVDFTYGAGGSALELVGKSGSLKAILSTEDYLYVFKETETYVISTSDVNTSTGASIPNLRSPIHGASNEDCVADMGNGEVALLTNDKRLIRFKIATDSGAPVIFPDESFDGPIRNLLRFLDPNQTGSHFFYHKGKRRLYCTVKIDSQWLRLVYDNNIGSWQPPQTGVNMGHYFERKGVAYGVSRTDDTVYQMDSTFNDNGGQIEFFAATGSFDVGNAQINECEVKGSITQNTTIRVKTTVNGADVQAKEISGSSFSYSSGSPVGSFAIGSLVLGGDIPDEDTAEYHKVFDVYPSDGNRVQVILSAIGDSSYFSLREFVIRGKAFRKPLPSLS